MSTLASTLKSEIGRVTRRELQRTIKPLAREVKSLRKELEAQRKRLAGVGSRGGAAPAGLPPAGPGVRLTPKSIRNQRKRLGLSQAEMARLVGVTPVAVYFWESGRTKPRGRTQAALVELRSLGMRDARSRVEEIDAANPRAKSTRKRGRAGKPGAAKATRARRK